MAKNFYDKEINKKVDWGGDESTEQLPVKGNRVQEFIKNTFDKKAGTFYYDNTNNRYLVFADEDTKNEYLEDTSKIDLILGTFDAPFNYSAEINLLTPNYVAILNGSSGNYIDFTFDTKNKQGQSVGEDVICTYTFIKNSVKKTVVQKYKYNTSIHFNIDSYLEAGTNIITIGIVGQNTLAATTISVTYQVVDLKIIDNMDIATEYNLINNPEATVAIPYTVSGTGVKTMEWYLDGEQLEFIKNEDEITEVNTTRTKYISVAGLSEGRHSIQFRVYTTINEEKFYSEILYRDIIVYKLENLNEIIAIAINIPIGEEIVTVDDGVTIKNISQYIPYELRFATFNPSASNSNVEILIDDNVVASFISTNRVENKYSLLLSSYGKKTLKIKTETSEYSIPINVVKSDTSLTEITEDLELDLQATGKSNNLSIKDIWEYGDYETKFYGFTWNQISGWINNRLLISNGAYITINIAPLSTDATSTGKTLEFEFSTTNVSDDNAVICDLRNENGVGLLITASEVTLKSAGGATVSTKYKSEENIRISLVINKKSGTTNKLLAFIYINGVISGAVNFASTDNFISNKEIKIASSADANINLKQLRFYNTALTSDQLLNNYILYRDNVEELVNLYDKNNIYAEDGYSFSTDILSGQLPIMIITGDIPTLENTTDKNLEIVVDVDYVNLQDQSRSFKITNGILRPQGTSSMSYPKKNYRLYTQRRDDTILYDSNGKVVVDKLYSFKENAQPVNCWCMKADYAESSGTHNTGIARLWNDVLKNARIDNEYVCRTEAQKKALENGYTYDVRTTVDGFPILMFYRLTADDDLIFIGKYNFNNDKSTESVFGFKDIPGFDNTHMQCWEVLNNGNHLALFQDVDNFDTEWTEAFEARYPDVGEDADITDLKNFATWLVSTKDDIEKFKSEKADHIDLYKMAAYYIYIMRFGAVDQTVKNAMFTSEDGQHFYYINYDNDTINGLRNDGLLIYPPTIDRQSLDESFTGVEVYAYAGHDSTLWNNLEADEEFMKLVSDVDNALFTAGLSYANVIEMFDNEQSDKWCERVYNQDAQYKYIGPYTDSNVNNLYMLQGKRSSHRKWWLSRRFNYLDSKFVSGDYKSNTFEIKVAGTPIGIDFSITAGFDMNYGYGVNNIPIETNIPLEVGESHTFTTKQVLNVGDPLRIYSAVNLQEIDVHNFIEYLTTVSVDKVYNNILGTKLKKLILGVDVSSDTRRNSSISEISGLKAAERLEYLDISGYKGITYLDLTPFKYFTTLKAKQSGLTSIDFAEGSPLNIAELPETLQTLTMNSLSITPENLKIENTWASLRYIDIKNCSNFRTNFNYFLDWYRNKSANNNECTLILEGINWDNITTDELIELGQLKVDGGTLSLKGKAFIENITEDELNILKNIYGENCFSPNNDFYISSSENIFILGEKEIYEGDIVKYTAAIFSDFYGKVIYSVNGNNVSINSETGLLTTEEVNTQRTITIQVVHQPTVGDLQTATLQVLVKKRIYPTITIEGESNINTGSAVYNAVFNTEDYNGKFTLNWSIEGEAVEQNYISIESQTEKRCIIKVNQIPESGVSNFTLKLNIIKSFETTFINKEISIVERGVIITSATNPEVMTICYEQGWCNSPNKMYDYEAALVTNIGTAFQGSNIKTFNEFKYFIGLSGYLSSSFANCKKLTNIILPNKNTIYLSSTFQNCSSLISIDIPNNVNELGANTFIKCTALTSVTFNNSVVSLGRACFSSCTSLREINLDDSITSIKGSIFVSCSNLSTIKLPKNLKQGGEYVTNKANSTKNIINISIDETNENYKTIDGHYLIDLNNNSLLFVSPLLQGELILNDIIEEYNINTFDGCFYECEKISNIIFNEQITSIKNSTFKLCISLTEIDLSNIINLETESLFENCNSLSKVILNDTITKLEYSCFRLCNSLAEIDLKNITYLGDYCFNTSGISNIDISKVTYIGAFCFGSCEKLTNVTFNDNAVLKNSCFRKSGLVEVHLPKILLEFPLYGFEYCPNLKIFEIFDISNTIYVRELLAHCLNLNTLICHIQNANKIRLQDSPFGTSKLDYVGRNTYNQGINKLIVPENAIGYDTSYWLDPLCNPEKCGFTLEKSLPAVETVETLSAKVSNIENMLNVYTSTPMALEMTYEDGTKENPFIWKYGMKLIKDNYYKENNNIYLCINSSEIPLAYSLQELVNGNFVKLINK